MKKILNDIAKNTAGMTKKDKMQYIMKYYWYHILGICAAIGLILFIIIHFGFADRRVEFSCAIVNQEIDTDRDEKVAMLAQKKFSDKEKVIVDSNYQFKYRGEKQEGINTSLFEKFFIKWGQGEISAVIADKDFLEYCVSSGGKFYSIDDFDVKGLDIYNEKKVSGIKLSSTGLTDYIDDKDNELILAFPADGAEKKECQKFIDFVQERG